MATKELKKQYKDFDKILPDARIAKLGGIEINISALSSGDSLALLKFADEQSSGEWGAQETLLKSVELLAGICGKDNPQVTTEFLLEHTTPTMLTEFINFVVSTTTGEEGNEEAAQ